jgi:hypothetical protein
LATASPTSFSFRYACAVSVTGLQGGAHRRGGLARRDQENPEAELRDGLAVVQHDDGHVGHLWMLQLSVTVRKTPQ